MCDDDLKSNSTFYGGSNFLSNQPKKIKSYS